MGVKVKGNLRVKDFQKRLKELPRTVAADVASEAAPFMTDETRTSFSGGTTVYGTPRPKSVDGSALALRKSGRTEEALRFTSEGTRVRAVLGPKNSKGVQYGRFLIGKYDILPNGPLPQKWREHLGGMLKRAVTEKIKGGA